jgi:lysophospholipid acyltransferase (LPLAT)-like uncharacterized protein
MTQTTRSQNINVWLAGVFGSMLLKAIHLTLSWENLGNLKDTRFWNTGGGRLVAFWHGRQLLMSFIKVDFDRKVPLYALISEHNDGRIIAAIVRRLGISSVAGSSSKHGSQATRELIGLMKAGSHVAITPDGPKGPAYHSKAGIIFLAALSGKPIYPMSYSAKSFWTFKSWDGMILPKPFSRAVRMIGEPIFVPRSIDKEQTGQFQAQLDTALNVLRDKLDRHVYL